MNINTFTDTRDERFQAAMNEVTQNYIERIGAVADEFHLDRMHVLWEEIRLLMKFAVMSDLQNIGEQIDQLHLS